MSFVHRNKGTRPYHLEEKKKTGDDVRSLGLDEEGKRRKFNVRDMLLRITNHAPGEKLSLRDGDQSMIPSLQETGLLNFGMESNPLVAKRTALVVPEDEIQTLTYTLEDKISKLRGKTQELLTEDQTA